MKKLKLGSAWLGLLEQIVYVCPTLGTVLYFYFADIKESISKASQNSFAMALVLFVLFIVYKKVMGKKVAELRQSVVQTETDLKNTPDTNGEVIDKLATNAASDRRKLDTIDRASTMITILIIALAVTILEKALIGLSMLSYIALGSVLAGYGVHLGVIELRKREAKRR